MPLTPLQLRVAAVLRSFRTRNNYVAGGAALNRDWPRLSDDMDIFHDRRRQLPDSVEPELQALRDAGFTVEITTEDVLIVEAILRWHGDETKVQWMDDPETCRRFFPAIDDDEFGFQLHPADVVVNKVLCASRRQQAARDAVDLVSIVNHYAPLGPLVWAVAGKEPTKSPPQIIRTIRTNAFGYADEEIVAVRMEGENPMTREVVRSILGPALDQALDYCDAVAPIEFSACLFIDTSETPVPADEEAVTNGTASAMPLKDFGIMPAIKNQG